MIFLTYDTSKLSVIQFLQKMWLQGRWQGSLNSSWQILHVSIFSILITIKKKKKIYLRI